MLTEITHLIPPEDVKFEIESSLTWVYINGSLSQNVTFNHKNTWNILKYNTAQLKIKEIKLKK